MPKFIELLPCDWLISDLCYQTIEQVYLIKWSVSVIWRMLVTKQFWVSLISIAFLSIRFSCHHSPKYLILFFTLNVANAMLYHWATGTAWFKTCNTHNVKSECLAVNNVGDYGITLPFQQKIRKTNFLFRITWFLFKLHGASSLI